MMFLTEMPQPRTIAPQQRPTNGETRAYQPPVALFETQDAYWLRAELPGLTPDDLDLSVARDGLVLKGEKPAPALPEGTEAKWHVVEGSAGRFERTFRFPTPIDPDAIEAETRLGVLTIRVPKAQEALPRQIQVNVK